MLCLMITHYTSANIYIVNTNADAGAGSLRQAIEDANINAGTDKINFEIAAIDVPGRTITLLTELPAIIGSLIIDGSSQTAGNGFGISYNKIQITSNNLSYCFSILADSCEIYGLYINKFQNGIIIESPYSKIGAIQKGNVIYRCNNSAIRVQSTHHAAIQGNLLGIDTSEAILSNATGNGIDIITSYAVSIGGKTLLAYNIISGNNYGVYLENATYIDFNSNQIGTSINGFSAKPNQYGIWSTGVNSYIEIGGDSVYERNLISGNTYGGIYGSFTNSVIQGNFIGTDSTGNGALGNGTTGIYFASGSSNNLVGGLDNLKTNTIAFNGQEAIYLTNGTCQANTFSHNRIFCNSLSVGLGGIQLNGGNGNIGPPQLSIVTSAGLSGITVPKGVIEIYADDTCTWCEGKTFLDSVIASSSGTFEYTAPLSGKITATVTDTVGNTSAFSVCSDSTVQVCLVAGFTTDSAACLNQPLNLLDQTITDPTSTILTWHWDFGNGSTSDIQSPSFSYTATDTYTVQLIVTNSLGCADTTSDTIIVNEAPAAQFIAPTTVCVNSAVAFTDQSFGGNSGVVTNWFWDFGDGSTSTEQNPVHTYNSSGIDTATLTVTNNFGCSNTTLLYITVVGSPVASFTVVQSLLEVTLTNTSDTTSNSSFLWSFGDGTTSTEDNPVHVYSNIGTYSICLTVFDSLCTLQDSSCQLLDVATGIYNLNSLEHSISITPNPAHDYITVSGNNVVIENIKLL
ncbi:MAG: PKD domain-containing protein, partial [Chitinophagales bacterium]|nr:PKD domain-containing protein [Chitinophagales bacterium]